MKKHCDHAKRNRSRDFDGFTGSETTEYVKVVFGMPLVCLSFHLYVHMYVCSTYICMRAIWKAVSIYFRQLM
jgi:hypothetical protein